MLRSPEKIIFPELSYQIIGLAYKVFNEFGYGLSEKHYQRMFAKELEHARLPFKREYSVKLQYRGETISTLFLDFIVEGSMVIELKVRPRFGYIDIKQVTGYLKATQCKLAILIYFTREGVRYRRVLNAL